MEKKKYSAFILLILFLATLILGSQVFFVLAENSANQKLEQRGAVLKAGERIEKPVNGLDSNLQYALEGLYKIAHPEVERINELTNMMFVDFVELNLSNQYIESLININLFYFDNLETLDLSNNSIQNVNSLYFSNMPKLKNLYLQDQKEDVLSTVDLSSSPGTSLEVYDLSSIEVLNISGNSVTTLKLDALNKLDGENLVGLNCLIANNNNIEEIDLSTVLASNGDGLTYINLNSNSFSDGRKIIFPRENNISSTNYVVLLLDNNIDSIATNDSISLFLGVQGLSEEFKSFSTSGSVLYGKINFENSVLRVEKVKITDGEKEVISVSFIKESDLDEFSNLIELLGVGEFELTQGVSSSADEISDETFTPISYVYLNGDEYSEGSALKTYKIKIIPNKPIVTLQYNKKEYSLSEFPKINSPAVLKFSSTDEGAEIYFKRGNSSEWVKLDEYKVTKGGMNFFSVKSVLNGYESEVQYVNVSGSNNLYIPDVVLLLIILLVAGGMFLVALPLIAKFVKKR